jgi:hypothetical protein
MGTASSTSRRSKGAGPGRVDGKEVPAKVGTSLRFDADTTRQPVAGPDGMTLIGVGARRGSYEREARSELQAGSINR